MRDVKFCIAITGVFFVGVIAGANRASMAEGDLYLLARQLTP